MNWTPPKLSVALASSLLAVVASAAGTAAPDNTARNERDRHPAAVTPMDQGNNHADIETSARIRQEVAAADHLSVTAQNVKIVTQNGRVTLRGPVNTPEEKRVIGEIAARIARNENVDNQLEVKPAPVSSN